MKRKKPAARSTRRAGASRRARAPKPITGARVAAMKRKLLEMREDLMRTVRNQQLAEAAGETGDSVDEASRSIEKELLFELSDNERVTLDQIEAALRKIDKGSYGLCEACRKPIAKPRLEALHFARYCIACQSTAETSATPEVGEQPSELRGMGEEAGREA